MVFFKNKHVLVTGAAGFIGSHLCEKLLEYGATVTAVDNFLTGRESNLGELLMSEYVDEPKFDTTITTKSKNFTFIPADINEDPNNYLGNIDQLDAIFHFASPASPPKYQAHPVETYLVNSFGTHLLLQSILGKFPRARFIFASTSEIYGDPQVHPQPESYWGNVNPNGIRSCYDESKRFGETICGVFHRQFNVDTRIVRIFNTYGPRMDPEDGRVIPDFIMNALRDKPLVIHGKGTQTRSYCFVEDLVAGILSLAAHPDGSGKTVNLGNPEEYSVLETAKIVLEMIKGEKIEEIEKYVQFKDLPADDPTRRRPDISLAKEFLHWAPEVSFRQGLTPTIEYFKSLL